MDDEQRKAIEELIRIARVASYTVRGMWFYAQKGSAFEAVLRDVETRLDVAAESAQAALTKALDTAVGERVH